MVGSFRIRKSLKNLNRRRETVVDPVPDLAVGPDVLAPDLCFRRQQGSEDGGPGTLVRGQGALVAGHVGVDVARVNVVDNQVLREQCGKTIALMFLNKLAGWLIRPVI